MLSPTEIKLAVLTVQRSVDQIERLAAGDFSIQVAGANIDAETANEVKLLTIAAISKQGDDAMTELLLGASPDSVTLDDALALTATAGRIRTVRERLEAERAQRDAQADESQGVVDSIIADEHEETILSALRAVGITDVAELEQIAPGVYTGIGTLHDGAEGSSFNTEAPRFAEQPWGPCSPYRAA